MKYKIGFSIHEGYTYIFNNEFYIFDDGMLRGLTFVLNKEKRAKKSK